MNLANIGAAFHDTRWALGVLVDDLIEVRLHLYSYTSNTAHGIAISGPMTFNIWYEADDLRSPGRLGCCHVRKHSLLSLLASQPCGCAYPVSVFGKARYTALHSIMVI